MRSHRFCTNTSNRIVFFVSFVVDPVFVAFVVKSSGGCYD